MKQNDTRADRSIPYKLLDLKTEYQPIMETRTREVYAYEALARVQYENTDTYVPLFPNELSLEELEVVEVMLKLNQFKNRPKNTPLFVNMHPKILQSRYFKSYWEELLGAQKNIIVEITESFIKDDAIASEEVCESLQKADIAVAIDDVFSEYSVFSSSLFCKGDAIKIDRGILGKIKENIAYKEILKGMSRFCKESQKVMILEGVETEEDYRVAVECEVDYIQGFLFRGLFITR